MYSNDSWVWQKKNESRFKAVETQSLFSTYGGSLKDRHKNSNIKERCDLKENVVVTIVEKDGHRRKQSFSGNRCPSNRRALSIQPDEISINVARRLRNEGKPVSLPIPGIESGLTKEGSKPPELSLTGRNSTAEAITLRLYYVRICLSTAKLAIAWLYNYHTALLLRPCEIARRS
ncbi:hypothetical protein EVAR_95698_1 [Eumeta japonica]|uniref:Uncharacterized protein n=1 Tax=Eumeta variegata TaxID=151549 RepID=A0A4C1VIM6_EUMVA|nr:hypothetical protein EVAR_95698_1 [Eumeta japonica]